MLLSEVWAALGQDDRTIVHVLVLIEIYWLLEWAGLCACAMVISYLIFG